MLLKNKSASISQKAQQLSLQLPFQNYIFYKPIVFTYKCKKLLTPSLRKETFLNNMYVVLLYNNISNNNSSIIIYLKLVYIIKCSFQFAY